MRLRWLSILVLVLMVSGCGSDDSSATDVSGSLPEGSVRFSQMFAGITVQENGSRVFYRYEGTDEVGGSQADRVVIGFDDNQFTIWFTKDEIVRVDVGPDVDKEHRLFLAQTALSFFPAMVEPYRKFDGLDQIADEFAATMGYELVGREDATVSGLPAEICVIQGTGTEGEAVTLRFGQFDGFMMLVHGETMVDGQLYSSFEITDIELR